MAIKSIRSEKSDMIVSNNEHPKKMKKGGKVKGAGIKGKVEGYVEGGTISTGPVVANSKNRKYKSGIKDYLGDYAKGVADLTTNVVGLDPIKSDDYNTKLGANAGNKYAAITGDVLGTAGAVAAGVATGNPLVTTGIMTGRKALKSTQKEDAGLAGKFTKQRAGLNLALDAGSSIASSQISSSSTESAPTPGETKVAPVDNTLIDSTGAQSPVEINSSMLPPDLRLQYDGLAGDPVAQQQILDDYNLEAMSQGKAKGGKIVGAGTAKSDSIKAKANDGDFIVPAENAKIAEDLREKYLGGNPEKVAPLKKGDVPVKLSNGEHKFTKAEYDLLVAKGIDVDSLAPNAEDKSELAKGGKVGDDKIKRAKELLAKKEKEKKEQDKLVSDAERRVENEKEKADYERRLKLIESDIDSYASNVEKSNNSINRKLLADATAKYDKIKSEYDNKFFSNFNANTKTGLATELGTITPPEGTGLAEPIVNKTATENKKQAAVTTNSGGIAGVGVGNKPLKKGLSALDTVKFEPSIITEEDAQKQADELALQTKVVEPEKVDANTLALQKSLEPKTTTPPIQPKEKNWLQRMGVGTGLGLAQTALGVSELLQDGKRPVGQIDPEFAQTVADAKKESMYGISPLERSIAERGIETNRRADVQNIINLSGGSAGTALGNIRAASLVANDASNNLSAMSESLRLQKKRYADNLVSQKSGMSRQLFEDKLNAFNTDQSAGAGLVGAGIQNVIGANRFDRALKAEQERSNIGKGSELPGITKKSEIQTLAGVVPVGTTDKDNYYRTFAKSKGFDYDSLK